MRDLRMNGHGPSVSFVCGVALSCSVSEAMAMAALPSSLASHLPLPSSSPWLLLSNLTFRRPCGARPKIACASPSPERHSHGCPCSSKASSPRDADVGHSLELKVMDEFLIQFEGQVVFRILSWHWVQGLVGLGPCWDGDFFCSLRASTREWHCFECPRISSEGEIAYVVAEEMDWVSN